MQADKWLKHAGVTGFSKKLVFTQPNQPFKCGGAPQKVMHLTSSEIVKAGGLKKLGFEFDFYYPSPRIFGVP